MLRGALKGLVIVLLAVVALVAAGFALSRWAPIWWGDPAAVALDTNAQERARDLEQALAAAVHKIRPDGEPWGMRIRDSDFNDWLITRLPEWSAHDGALALPIEGAVGQVHFEAGQIVLGLKVDGRVWSGAFGVEVEPESIRIEPGSAAVGRMPLPMGAELVAKLLRGEAASALRVPRKFALADGRTVEVRRVVLTDGAIEIELATLR